MSERHRTVSRVVGILELVSRSPEGLTMQEIVRALDAPKSSVHGFVRGLVAEGYLIEASDGRYVFGTGAHSLLASTGTSLVEVLRPSLEALSQAIDETITLAVPVGDELAYVHSIPSSNPIAYLPRLHVRRSPWPTSAGKVFLAYGAISRQSTVEVWRAGSVDADAADEELLRVRCRGYALNISESVTDVAAVAVGVRLDGRLVGAVSIAGPRARIEKHLKPAAERARLELGALNLGTTETE